MATNIVLKPCPFCGQKPRLFGMEKRDYVELIDDETKEMTNNGWAKKSAKVFWVQPFCMINCILGCTHSAAYGIVGGPHYKTKEAAAKAWNKRYEEEETK